MRAEFLFVLLLAMCVVIGAAFVIDEVPADLGHGFAHEQFPSMDKGGPGVSRHTPTVLVMGGIFAALQTVFIIACLAFGVRRRGNVGPFKIPLLVGGLFFTGIVVLLVVSYRQYMLDPDPALFLSLPGPTAWYLYGFWPLQLFFVALYVLMFDRWVTTDDDMARFRQILARNQRRGSS
jgi:hypothetical protein